MTSTLTRKDFRAKAIAAVAAIAATAGMSLVAVPPADAAPTVPQQPGYTIRGYDTGQGNYRGAIDQETGALWVTQVSPMNGPTNRSVILKLDPNTMKVQKRINVTQKAQVQGKRIIAGQYEVGIPRTGSMLWATAAAANGGEANVWDKNTGKLIKNLPNLSHAHSVIFAEGIRVAAITVTDGIAYFDMDTYQPLGTYTLPGKKRLGAGAVVSEDMADGATIALTSYYRDLTRVRITRDDTGQVRTTVKWNTRQRVAEGHGSVAVDESTNRLYVNNLWEGLSVYDWRTGRHIKDVTTGPGTNSMFIFQGKLYAANYYLAHIAVIDQKNLSVTRRLSTGFMPNQLFAWKKNTFMVIDKSSSTLELPGASLGFPSSAIGGDHIWKVSVR